jgi:hypothetical protein
MSFQHLLWLFPLVVTLHNAEEAIWLPGWSKRDVLWHDKVTPGSFRFAIVVLTLMAFSLTGLCGESGKQTVWAYLVVGYMVAMWANIFLPHIALTIALHSYMPGVATAVVLNLPVLSLLIVAAFREGYVSGEKAVVYSAGMAGLLLASIPILFKTGKVLNL